MAATLAPVPLIAQTPQRDGMRRLGVLLQKFGRDDPLGQADAAALVQALGALNWHEGGNLRIDWRWSDAVPALLERYAAELVALGPDVLVAEGSNSVVALRRHTSAIPIVFAVVADPVGQGFVASLAHPGGNITGFSDYDPPIASKWLQMLTEIKPPVARVAVLYNPTTAAQVAPRLRVIEDAAPAFAVAVRAAPVKDIAEIEGTMKGLAREERGGVVILPDNFMDKHRDGVIALAAQYRLPTVYPWSYDAAAGGLMSYGITTLDTFRRAAGYVDRILKGDKPSDLPVQNPTKYELVFNLKTAAALGITIPPSLLLVADEVIE